MERRFAILIGPDTYLYTNQHDCVYARVIKKNCQNGVWGWNSNLRMTEKHCCGTQRLSTTLIAALQYISQSRDIPGIRQILISALGKGQEPYKVTIRNTCCSTKVISDIPLEPFRKLVL